MVAAVSDPHLRARGDKRRRRRRRRVVLLRLRLPPDGGGHPRHGPREVRQRGAGRRGRGASPPPPLRARHRRVHSGAEPQRLPRHGRRLLRRGGVLRLGDLAGGHRHPGRALRDGGRRRRRGGRRRPVRAGALCRLPGLSLRVPPGHPPVGAAAAVDDARLAGRGAAGGRGRPRRHCGVLRVPHGQPRQGARPAESDTLDAAAVRRRRRRCRRDSLPRLSRATTTTLNLGEGRGPVLGRLPHGAAVPARDPRLARLLGGGDGPRGRHRGQVLRAGAR